MRTLERAFAREYQQTMSQCQVQVRLSFSKWMLSLFPPTKISVVAALLGYEQVQDFNRFFKKHVNQPPSDWSSGEQKRDDDAAENPSRNR
jgi:AraC-like DNA-binding protein